MGTKFSKAKTGNDGTVVVEESNETFDKTATLPATFEKKDEEDANKAGTMPRGGLDRSTSFSKRFRKSMTRLVRHKKVDSDAKPVSEPTENPVTSAESVKQDEEKADQNKEEKPEVKKEEEEDDAKTAQMKARAQFFEDMYSSDEPANVPKPPRSYVTPSIEKVTEEEEEIGTVAVSVIGSPVVKLIDKHEEGNGTQQETTESNTNAADVTGLEVEVVDPVAETKGEVPASTVEVNDRLKTDNSEEKVTAELMDGKIIESTAEKSNTMEEVNVTCSAGSTIIEHDDDVTEQSNTEQKNEPVEKEECEDEHDESQSNSTIEGVETENNEEKKEESSEMNLDDAGSNKESTLPSNENNGVDELIDEIEESGAPSLESKGDSQMDDLSSEDSSECGMTTDEGIVATDDEEKEIEEDPKMKLGGTEKEKIIEAVN